MGTTHLVLLRSALLPMKTAMLAVVVDSDNKPLMQALWNAVKQTAASMRDFHIKAQTHSEQTELYTSAEAAEAQHLALLLVEVVLRVLHQDAAVTDAALPYTRDSLPDTSRHPHGKQQMHCHVPDLRILLCQTCEGG